MEQYAGRYGVDSPQRRRRCIRHDHQFAAQFGGQKDGQNPVGAVWLDAAKTSPFEFYQYWRNVADADVLKCLRMLTFLPLEQIAEMESWEGSQLNKAKEILAYELTKLVHNEEEAIKKRKKALVLYFPVAQRLKCPQPI